MRILMTSDVYFPRINGVSTSIETFRARLGAEGVEVRLVAPDYGHGTSPDWVTRVAGRAIPGDPEDRLLHWGAMHRTVRDLAIDSDLVHIQTPFVAHYAGLAAARRIGLPVIATYHTLFEEYLQHYARFLPASLLKKQARAWSRRQCNALDAVVVPSQAMIERLSDYGVTAPMHVLPTGIPLARFGHGDGAAFRRRHDIEPGRPVALYVGRLAHEKNIGFLLEMMTHLRFSCPAALLLVTGEGPAMADLRRQAEQLEVSDRVRFLGYLDRESELPDCYAAADAFVFASRTETQGLVLLEAMAAGLPVVALSAMGTADILAPRRGAIVAPDNVVGFAAVLADFFDRTSARAGLACEARLYAAEWSDAAMARRLAHLYENIIGAKTRGDSWKVHTRAEPA